MQRRFVARFSPYRLLFLILLSLGFVVLSLWLVGAFGAAPDAPMAWSGWVGLLFFGPCTVILARRVSDPRAQIILDEQGLYWRQWSEAVIPWTAFSAMEVCHVQRQRLLGLTLARPQDYPPETMLGQLARYNEQLGFPHVTLSAQGMDCSFDELHDAVRGFLPRHAQGERS